MPDLEKAIRIFEGNYKNFVLRSNGEVITVTDVIALLKEREPVAPIEHYIPDEAHRRKSLAWECGNCLIDIGYGVNYCYNCGRAVKWG